MHLYTHPVTLQPLLSVTSILAETMPDDRRATLDRWYANNPQSYFKNAESQRRGLAVDAWAKAYLAGRSAEIDWQFMGHCHQLIPHLDQIKQTAGAILSDQLVYTNDYAGTLDLAYFVDGCYVVEDLKSKDRISTDTLADAFLQAIAYRNALTSMGYPTGPIAIAAVTKKKFELFRVDDPTELQQLSASWQARLNLYLGRCYVQT